MRFRKSEQIIASLLLLFPGTMILCGVLYFLAVITFHWQGAERAVYGPYTLWVATVFSPFQLVAAGHEVGFFRELVFTRQSLPRVIWHIVCTLLAMLLVAPLGFAMFVLWGVNLGS